MKSCAIRIGSRWIWRLTLRVLTGTYCFGTIQELLGILEYWLSMKHRHRADLAIRSRGFWKGSTGGTSGRRADAWSQRTHVSNRCQYRRSRGLVVDGRQSPKYRHGCLE